MKTVQQTVSMFVAAVAVCATFVAAAPAATAADQSGVVASERSFPKTSVARKDVLKESVSTDVKGNWGGIESLNVPKTKSQAEKDAEAKAEPRNARRRLPAPSRKPRPSRLQPHRVPRPVPHWNPPAPLLLP